MRSLTFGSLFDGAGCFTLGLSRAGLIPRWTVEIDADCRRVTAGRFGVRQYADIHHVGGRNLERVDVIVGGSPCQGLSVAGRRGGLADERSSLVYEMARVADEVRPAWLVWENVPGCLSSFSGEDFACVLELFSGYRPGVPAKGWLNSGVCVGPKRACAWRVLDAQYFGLAQRRKRVFLVGRSGGLRGLDLTQPGEEAGRLRGLPVEVLFEPDCLPGRPRPRRRPQPEDTAGPPGDPPGRGVVGPLLSGGSAGRGHRLGADEVCAGHVVPYTINAAQSCARKDHAFTTQTARTLDVNGSFAFGQGGTVVAFNIVSMSQQGSNHAYRTDVSGCLQHKGLCPTGNEASTVIAFNMNQDPVSAGVCPTIGQGSGSGRASVAALVGGQLRRLTPLECTRLMGLPDDWLDIDPPLCDSAKYRMVGCGGAVPVLEWLGRRLAGVDRRP